MLTLVWRRHYPSHHNPVRSSHNLEILLKVIQRFFFVLRCGCEIWWRGATTFISILLLGSETEQASRIGQSWCKRGATTFIGILLLGSETQRASRIGKSWCKRGAATFIGILLLGSETQQASRIGQALAAFPRKPCGWGRSPLSTLFTIPKSDPMNAGWPVRICGRIWEMFYPHNRNVYLCSCNRKGINIWRQRYFRVFWLVCYKLGCHVPDSPSKFSRKTSLTNYPRSSKIGKHRDVTIINKNIWLF